MAHAVGEGVTDPVGRHGGIVRRRWLDGGGWMPWREGVSEEVEGHDGRGLEGATEVGDEHEEIHTCGGWLEAL